MHFKKTPFISLSCKLVPVQYREYEYENKNWEVISFHRILLFSFLFTLTVGNKPKILVHPPDHVHAIKGQTMFLNCLTTGIPTPIDHWYYVGPVFSQHVKHSIRNNSKYAIYSNGTLVIRNLQTKDMGVYECKASNIIGSTSKQFKIYTPSKLSFRMKQIDFKCP